MINLCYFTDRALQVGFKIVFDSHHINHSNSNLAINPKFPEFGIEPQYINKIVTEMSVIFARLTTQYKLKYQTVFRKI